MTLITAPTRPGIVTLADPRARDADLTGAKAAALAEAAAMGLPVLDGFVLTTAWSQPQHSPELLWRKLSGDGTRPLVVRSSSVAVDGAEHSMAGMFTSVLGVRGWPHFEEAVERVLASADAPAAAGTAGGAAMAVLVQPFLPASWGGVVFTADPVTARTDRMMITAVRGGPDAVVSGAEDGWTALLTRSGRVRRVLAHDAPGVPGTVRRKVIRMALRAERMFGGPQDIEWAVDAGGAVRLLQARPITTLHGRVRGPILGPGPLAETFPDPLRPLEQDLWLTPLAEGLRVALELTGAAPAQRIRESPVATSVLGIAVADLELLGAIGSRRRLIDRLDPRPGARKLGAAMRVGRLAAAMPALARRVCERVDADLAAVPSLTDLSRAQLLATLDNSRTALTALHGYEALAGMLGRTSDSAPTAAAMALAALHRARAEAVPADRVIEEFPVVLALTPPRIGEPATPPDAEGADLPADDRPVGELALAREALRLRTRWVQELSARAAWELGVRLTAEGVVDSAASIAQLRFDQVVAATRGHRSPVPGPASNLGPADGAGPADSTGPGDTAPIDDTVPGLPRMAGPWGARPTSNPLPASGGDRGPARASTDTTGSRADAAVHLPARFRLAEDGWPVPIGERPGSGEGGVGAGGGSGRGVVHIGDNPPPGSVLVVRHLDPRLAVVVPCLAGLIAETGSPLSHVAILAREQGIPVVVGYPDATRRLPDGAVVELDGRTGSVRVIGDGEVRR
ncbi:PEP/pyruvate-binding domain-containing protein [Nocardia cyriacigeorgica]|uniref:PEP/pyruvate-binding domain-containing protein n=1 Tax=Nocardia cyriacigeorgica TaxID=135487 RepID=UPI0024544371|nr:PEP/pyruvate-binding domain-containing protein [Nocardia cyriacigeorgica]